MGTVQTYLFTGCLFLWIPLLLTENLRQISRVPIDMQPKTGDIIALGQKAIVKIKGGDITETIYVSAKSWDPEIVRVINKDLFFYANNSSSLKQAVWLLGIKPGRTRVSFNLLHENKTFLAPLNPNFEVTVVQRMNLIHDAFMYVLLTMQMITLLFLGFRLRGAALKEVIRRPCALLLAVVCQVILFPMITIGISTAMSLPVHAVVCLLVLGCCPTGMLSPIFSVIQQAHVELAISLMLLQTAMAFGAMPLWLFAYGTFLGLAYGQVSYPYFFIAATLAVSAGPTLMGLVIQHCAGKVTQVLPRMDRAIQPVSALVALMSFTIGAFSFSNIWHLMTWRHLLSCIMLPSAGVILGAVSTTVFRQALPQLKSVAIVLGVPNTLLATVLIQASYPQPESSLMMATLICVNFMTLCIMALLYIPHTFLWFLWPKYQVWHDNAGISAIYVSVGEKIVRSMIKAGEIKFGTGETEQNDSETSKVSTPVVKRPVAAAAAVIRLDNNHATQENKELTCDKLQQVARIPGDPVTVKVHTFAAPAFVSSKKVDKSDESSLNSIDYEMLNVKKESPPIKRRMQAVIKPIAAIVTHVQSLVGRAVDGRAVPWSDRENISDKNSVDSLQDYTFGPGVPVPIKPFQHNQDKDDSGIAVSTECGHFPYVTTPVTGTSSLYGGSTSTATCKNDYSSECPESKLDASTDIYEKTPLTGIEYNDAGSQGNYECLILPDRRPLQIYESPNASESSSEMPEQPDSRSASDKETEVVINIGTIKGTDSPAAKLYEQEWATADCEESSFDQSSDSSHLEFPPVPPEIDLAESICEEGSVESFSSCELPPRPDSPVPEEIETKSEDSLLLDNESLRNHILYDCLDYEDGMCCSYNDNHPFALSCHSRRGLEEWETRTRKNFACMAELECVEEEEEEEEEEDLESAYRFQCMSVAAIPEEGSCEESDSLASHSSYNSESDFDERSYSVTRVLNSRNDKHINEEVIVTGGNSANNEDNKEDTASCRESGESTEDSINIVKEPVQCVLQPEVEREDLESLTKDCVSKGVCAFNAMMFEASKQTNLTYESKKASSKNEQNCLAKNLLPGDIGCEKDQGICKLRDKGKFEEDHTDSTTIGQHDSLSKHLMSAGSNEPIRRTTDVNQDCNAGISNTRGKNDNRSLRDTDQNFSNTLKVNGIDEDKCDDNVGSKNNGNKSPSTSADGQCSSVIERSSRYGGYGADNVSSFLDGTLVTGGCESADSCSTPDGGKSKNCTLLEESHDVKGNTRSHDISGSDRSSRANNRSMSSQGCYGVNKDQNAGTSVKGSGHNDSMEISYSSGIGDIVSSDNQGSLNGDTSDTSDIPVNDDDDCDENIERGGSCNCDNKSKIKTRNKSSESRSRIGEEERSNSNVSTPGEYSCESSSCNSAFESDASASEGENINSDENSHANKISDQSESSESGASVGNNDSSAVDTDTNKRSSSSDSMCSFQHVSDVVKHRDCHTLLKGSDSSDDQTSCAGDQCVDKHSCCKSASNCSFGDDNDDVSHIDEDLEEGEEAAAQGKRSSEGMQKDGEKTMTHL